MNKDNTMASQDTFELKKDELIQQSYAQMDTHLADSSYTLRQKLALTAASCSTTGTTPALPDRSPPAPACRASS